MNAKFAALGCAFFSWHISQRRDSFLICSTHTVCLLSDVHCNDYSLNLMTDIKLTIWAMCWIILFSAYGFHSTTNLKPEKYSCEFDVNSARSTQPVLSTEALCVWLYFWLSSQIQLFVLGHLGIICWIFLYMCIYVINMNKEKKWNGQFIIEDVNEKSSEYISDSTGSYRVKIQ